MALWGKTDATLDRPNWIDLANYPAGTQLVFVDQSEAQVDANKAKGITGAGWWLYRTYTDANSNTRHKAECVVALRETAAAAGDAEDVITVDLTITVGSIAADPSLSVTAPDPITLSIAPSINSSDVPMTYQWQVDDQLGGGMVDIVGATSASYTIADTTGLNGYQYQVVVTGGEATVTATAVTLVVA